jgi:hypothetical protein
LTAIRRSTAKDANEAKNFPETLDNARITATTPPKTAIAIAREGSAVPYVLPL